MKYSGLRDRHLNVFVNYASSDTDKDSEHLENNITKAFINTLESLTDDANKDDTNKKVFKSLFGIDLPDKFTCKYYLQWSSTNEEIKQTINQIPKENRILFAFSPTGESWGIEGSDTKNDEELKAGFEKLYQEKEPGISDGELSKKVNARIEEIKKIRNGNSIPDALIIVSIGETPMYAIAMENKKYDLDPYQLNNHLEKSLILQGEEKKGKIKYKKYRKIIDSIKELRTYMTDSFVEYMVMLDYYKSDSFEESFNADEELRQRIIKTQIRMTLHFSSLK